MVTNLMNCEFCFMSTLPNTLPQRWDCLKKRQPKLRIVDAAYQLGVSEGELLASQCPDTAIRLRPEWHQIFSRLKDLGPVMALSRNQSSVHERIGIYDNIRITQSMGLVMNREIDLRMFLSQWKHVFAADVQNPKGILKSLQFFDKYGKAIHKLYLKPQSNLQAYKELVDDLKADDQSPMMQVESNGQEQESKLPDKKNSANNQQAAQLKSEWRSLKDPHQFFPMLKRLGLTRQQAMHLVGLNLARPLSNDALETCLRVASGKEIPLMIFVANSGIVQIHTETVHKVNQTGDWINILDEDFNLHVKQTDVDEIWAVKKPADGGEVNSLEVFDKQGNLIVQIFGERKPGQLERRSWLKLIQSL